MDVLGISKHMFSDKDTDLLTLFSSSSEECQRYVQELCFKYKFKIYANARVGYYQGGTCSFSPFAQVGTSTASKAYILSDEEGRPICYAGATRTKDFINNKERIRHVYHFESAYTLNDTNGMDNYQSISSLKLSYVLNRIAKNIIGIRKTRLISKFGHGEVDKVIKASCDVKKSLKEFSDITLPAEMQQCLLEAYLTTDNKKINAHARQGFVNKLDEFKRASDKITNHSHIRDNILKTPMYVFGTYRPDSEGAKSNVVLIGTVRPTINQSGQYDTSTLEVKHYYGEDYKLNPVYDTIKGKLLMYKLYLDNFKMKDDSQPSRISPYHSYFEGWHRSDIDFVHDENSNVITVRDESRHINIIWTIVYNIE